MSLKVGLVLSAPFALSDTEGLDVELIRLLPCEKLDLIWFETQEKMIRALQRQDIDLGLGGCWQTGQLIQQGILCSIPYLDTDGLALVARPTFLPHMNTPGAPPTIEWLDQLQVGVWQPQLPLLRQLLPATYLTRHVCFETLPALHSAIALGKLDVGIGPYWAGAACSPPLSFRLVVPMQTCALASRPRWIGRLNQLLAHSQAWSKLVKKYEPPCIPEMNPVACLQRAVQQEQWQLPQVIPADLIQQEKQEEGGPEELQLIQDSEDMDVSRDSKGSQ